MNGFDYSSLVPDAGAAVQSGVQTGLQFSAMGERQRAADANRVAGELVAESIGLSADELIKLPKAKEFATADPEGFLALYTAAQNKDAAAIKNLREQNDFQSQIIGNIKKLAPEKRGAAFLTLAQQYQSSDPDLAAELLDLYNMPPEQQAQQIDAYAIQSDIGDEFFGAVASSTIGKLQSDRARAVQLYGEGSPQVKQFDAAIQKETTEQGSNRGVQFLPTAKGYAVGNLATGEINLPEGALMPATADPTLQRTIATETAAGGAQGKLEEERDQVFIDQGVAAQSGLADIKRAKELLKTINTGGYVAAKDKAAQWFGIQSEDEGEFKNLLGQQTLAALKTTFGGNPTEGERAILTELQGSLANSKGVNERILNRAMKAYETKANRGKAVAKKKGLDWDLLTGAGQQPEAEQPPPSGVKFLGFE